MISSDLLKKLFEKSKIEKKGETVIWKKTRAIIVRKEIERFSDTTSLSRMHVSRTAFSRLVCYPEYYPDLIPDKLILIYADARLGGRPRKGGRSGIHQDREGALCIPNSGLQ